MTEKEPTHPPSAALHVVGLLLMLFGVGMAAMLALERLAGLRLPGCGVGSPCAQAAASVWGRVPVIDWPVSYVGLSYFLAIFVAWLISRRGVVPPVKHVVRFGGAVSIGFILVMVLSRHLCHYCLGAHLANLAFWFLVERWPVDPMPSPRPLTGVLAVFIVTSTALSVADAAQQRAAVREAGRQLDASTREIIESISRAPSWDSASEQGGFTGRYHLGPQVAPLRLVIISDYQCEDCRRVEQGARSLIANRKDLSLSAKHFPMCSDCNEYARNAGFNPHPNACRAARAAEAAGILRGSEGFWPFHTWLFETGGAFDDEQLDIFLRAQGYDVRKFRQVMDGEQALAHVEADIEEAIGLGLRFTPMIFVNGHQLVGVRNQAGLATAISRIAATNPPPGASAQDTPPTAIEKLVLDWKNARVEQVPADEHPRFRGPENAPVTVTIWGDYQEPFTAETDTLVREMIAAYRNVRYDFRHYPVNQECNPVAATDKHPLACRASRVAEAAGITGGADGYWKMHDWLMHNREAFGDESVRAAAAGMGLDPDRLFAALSNPQVDAAIAEDARAAKALQLTSIPFIMVNGKMLRKWRDDGDVVMREVLEQAGASAAP